MTPWPLCRDRVRGEQDIWAARRKWAITQAMNRSLYHLLWRETQRRAEDRDRTRHVDDLRKNRRQEEKVGFLKSPYWSVLTVTNSDDDDVISAQEKGCSVFKQYFNATVPNLLCSKDRLAGTRRFHIKKLNGNDQIIFECWLLAWMSSECLCDMTTRFIPSPTLSTCKWK